jgi:hypothetical protein
VGRAVSLVGLAQSVAPVLDHALLLYTHKHRFTYCS